jgi:hypothetical protein
MPCNASEKEPVEFEEDPGEDDVVEYQTRSRALAWWECQCLPWIASNTTTKSHNLTKRIKL